MAQKFVVGLFESKGTAEDAVNRLKTEGLPARDITLMMLRETAPKPAVVTAELAAFEVDPFVVGDVQRTYAPYIHNGETAVFVRAHEEREADLAVSTIRQYAPIKIRVVSPEEGTALGHDVL
ncbi:MAG TPA: hypothetical protein VME41_09205 [Stellaceae bacterium]|nr:hypothetical protein [Stellaceae bacterium]